MHHDRPFGKAPRTLGSMASPQSDDAGLPGARRGRRRSSSTPWLQPLGSTSAGAPAPPVEGERPWFDGADALPAERSTWFEPPGAAPLVEPGTNGATGRAWFDEDVDPGPTGTTAARPLPPSGVPVLAPPPGPTGAPATATGGGSGQVPVVSVSRSQRRRSAKPRVRRVSRVVRRIDAWSVFKVSLIFYVVLYAVLLVAGALLWALAVSTGTIDNTESFIQELFGLDTFSLNGRQIFEASWVIGAVMVVAGTGLNVALAVLFNLISDLVGGVRVTVLEEEVVRRYPVDATPRRGANVPRPPGL
jgi:hypothetical protein